MTPLWDFSEDSTTNIKLNLAIWSFVAAIVFAAAGFYVPPMGEINSSVLYFCAQLLILTATFLGISASGISFFTKKKGQKGIESVK